jgi:hypothetical protein
VYICPMRFAFVLAPFVMLACSSSSSSPGTGGGQQAVDDYCARRCAREHICITSTDESTCVAKCKNDGAASGTKLRGDYLAGINTCLDGVDCAKWATEQAKCPAVSRASIAPTQAVQDFCNALIKKQTDCSTLPANLALCLESVKIAADSAVADASACLSKPCADYQACVNAAFGGR